MSLAPALSGIGATRPLPWFPRGRLTPEEAVDQLCIGAFPCCPKAVRRQTVWKQPCWVDSGHSHQTSAWPIVLDETLTTGGAAAVGRRGSIPA